MEYLIYNGEIVRDTALLTINNRAFRYGDGLFESMRYTYGFIPFLSQHLIRLNRGMQLLGYNLCDCLEENQLSILIADLVNKNQVEGAARIRLSVFRKEGGLYAPESDDFDFIIELEPLAHSDFKLETKGLIVGISKKVQKPIGPLSEIKSSSALLQVLAARDAKKQKWNEALLLNHNGNIAEGTSSNLFIVKYKTIYTPPLSDGGMDGIMRQQIALIVKNSNYSIKVKSLNANDLENADEIFLTNAIKGIIWVVGYGKKRYFNKAAKELTKLLNEAIQKLIISNSDM